MDNLRILRKNMGKTQKEMAEDLGLNRATYARYEAGESLPTHETLMHIAHHFGCSVDYLLGYDFKDGCSKSQRELISNVVSLNDFECEKVLAFIKGMKS